MLSDGRSLSQLLTATAFVRICGAVSQLVMTITITQSMSSQDAGRVLFAYALVMLISQLSLLGTEVSGLRKIAIDLQAGDVGALREASASRMRLVLATSLAGGLLMVLAIHAAGAGGAETLSLLQLAITSLAVPLYALVLLLAELLKGIGKPVVGLAFQNVLIPVVVVAMVLVRRLSDAASADTYVISAIAAACAVATTGALCVYASSIDLKLRSLRVGQVGQLFREAPWVAPVSATPAIIQWSGAALLGVMASPADVALYVVAARVTIAVSVIHSAVASVAGPRLAVACHSGDLHAFRAASVQTGLLISATALPLLALFFIFPEPVLRVFGPSYAQSGAEILRILLLGQMVAAICGHSGTVLLMAGKFRLASANSMFFGVLQLSMLSVLVPLYGAWGAAVSTAFTAALGHIVTLMLVRMVVKMWPIPLTLRETRLGLQGKFL